MSISATELAEVAPKTPIACCVVDNRWIVTINNNSATSGLMPNGSFSVFDTTTETAKAYTGLSTSTTAAFNYAGSCVVAAGGYAWAIVMNGSTLYRISPSTGAVTSIGLPDASSQKWIAATSTHIVVTYGTGSKVPQRVDISTLAVTSGASSFTMRTPIGSGSLVYGTTGSGGCYAYDPVADSLVSLGSIPILDSTGVIVGNTWWGLVWSGYEANLVASKLLVAPYTVATYSHALVPGGTHSTVSDLVSHSGWLYCYGSSDYLIGLDPATGAFGKAPLTPTRGRRYTVASAAGKLWIPSGEPLT